MKITVLGCGASLGTPATGGYWGKCDPAEPRNQRTRASILVESQTTKILVDTTYDVRLHLNRLNMKDLDGVLISHSHSDHVNGIDDLRVIAYHNNKLIDLYTNQETTDELERRWPHLFTPQKNVYTPFLEKKVIEEYDRFTVGDIEVESFAQDHMTCTSLGFRFGGFAYCVDVADLNEKSLGVLKGIETWIVDAGGYQRETTLTHANLKRVMEWVDVLKPKMTYLTVLTTHMDYKTLCNELPPHIRPAYDGLEIDMGGNRR